MDQLTLLHRANRLFLIVKLAIIFGLGIIFVACSKPQEVIHLPTPELNCPINVDWFGIVPGKSTNTEVINILGKPANEGNKRFGNMNEKFIAYSIDRGLVSNYVQDKIYFRSDGIVDWIEVVVADRDGSFHPISEITNTIGLEPDLGYFNNNFDPSNKSQHDVLGGPDQIDVWSECGLALNLLPGCAVSDANGIRCSTDGANFNENLLSFRYTSPYNVGPTLSQSKNDALLMKFIFQPTSYEGFKNYYMYRIPFGIWDTYVTKISH